MRTSARLVIVLLAASLPPAHAGLVGAGFGDGKLYDVSTATGATSNPKNLGTGWAISFSPGGVLYGVTQSGGSTPQNSTLFTVDPATGNSVVVAVTNPAIGVEGDIAFDPTSSLLYAVDGVGTLFRINTSNGAGVVIGNIPGAMDCSAMAFDNAGNLFVVDTNTTLIRKVNKANASVISSVNLVPPPNGGVAGLVFDPVSGTCYLASGSGTTNNLYTVDPNTGAMQLVGALTGTADGLGALAFTPIPLDYAPFCFGDGSISTACPCALPNTVPNPPAIAGHGCANSFDLDGALLGATGTVSPDTVKATCSIGPSYAGFAFLVKGNAINANGVASHDGILCVTGALVRFGGHNAGTNGDALGSWSYPNNAQTTAISIATAQLPAQNAYYQLFYRNAAANFCNASTANWSNGIQLSWP